MPLRTLLWIMFGRNPMFIDISFRKTECIGYYRNDLFLILLLGEINYRKLSVKDCVERNQSF